MAGTGGGMKNGYFLIVISLCLSACTFTTDEGYIRCLQGLNTVGSGVKVPAGAAAKVLGAGSIGAAAGVVLCEEPEITETPDVFAVEVPGDLSQPLEVRRTPMMVSSPPDLVPVEPVLAFVLDSRTLAFELGKAQLRPGVEKILFPVVEFLTDYPEARVRVSGHTCWLGSPESNLALSRQRAEAVAAYLMSQGIDGDRLLVTAEGESQPIDTNLTEEGRQSNRRVEVVQL